jgi:hypothetical protein
MTQLKSPFTYSNGIINHHAERFAAAYCGCKRSRYWNFDPSEQNWLSACALSAAVDAQREGEPHDKILAQVLEAMTDVENFGSNVLQPRPPELKIPKPWLDPVTNQPLPSPFDLPDGPEKRKALVSLRKRDPELFEHFEKMHADPYGRVAEIRAEQERVAKVKNFVYNSDTDRVNPWRTNDHAMQGVVAKTDPLGAEICKRESVPASLDLENLTRRGRLAQHHPVASKIVEKAVAQKKQWLAEIAQAEKIRREALRRAGVEMHDIMLASASLNPSSR